MAEPDDVPPGELCDRYAALYTGAIADALDERGHRDRTVRADLQPVEPGMQFAGFAHTAVGTRNVDVDPEAQIRAHLEMVGETPEHGALVVATNDAVSAQIGELMTAALMAQNARGCVCDGGTRDIAYIREQGFPVFTGYTTPEDSVPRWELLDWDVDVIVGGVDISPGDVIVGDADGIVVVPRDLDVEILEAAEKLVHEENRVRAAILDGRSPLDAYEEYGVF